MSNPGDVLAGRYVLERPLGGGGMGHVWIARHLTLDRLVAIKVMTPEAHSSSVLRARFEREAKACALLRSPHVVQVFDYGVDGDLPFLVMELLEGEDLAALQEDRPRWPLGEVASLVQQAARGLTEAHEAGIVHRDIKLSNLFVARMPGASVLKILDFGIARAFQDGSPKVTRTDVQLGTPSYMAPEVVLDQPVDHRVDVWALAIVAFRLLTGSPAFEGETPLEVVQNIAKGDRRRVGELVTGLPEELEAFFERGLAASAAERFGSASELAAALSRVAEAHPGAIGLPRDPARHGEVGAIGPHGGAPHAVGPRQPPVERTDRHPAWKTQPMAAVPAVAAPAPPSSGPAPSTPEPPSPPSPVATPPDATPSVWLPSPSFAPPGNLEPPTQRVPASRGALTAWVLVAAVGLLSLGLAVVRPPTTWFTEGEASARTPSGEVAGTASAVGPARWTAAQGPTGAAVDAPRAADVAPAASAALAPSAAASAAASASAPIPSASSPRVPPPRGPRRPSPPAPRDVLDSPR